MTRKSTYQTEVLIDVGPVTCTRCGQPIVGDLEVPYRRKKNGLSSFCRLCHIAAVRKWQDENPEKVRAARRKRWEMRDRDALREQRRAWVERTGGHRPRNLMKHYRLTVEAFDALLASQNGGCAVCGNQPVSSARSMHVDHDHACCPGTTSCGVCVRGILCSGCNLRLGILERMNEAWNQQAVAYLERNARG